MNQNHQESPACLKKSRTQSTTPSAECPAVSQSSSRERVAVCAIRERVAGDIEGVPLVEVEVDPEGGVHADDGGGDDEGDEEVEPRAGERDGEDRCRREHGQHDAVVDLAS